ncbi:unnamed protein product, partial [Larinioides sclopetarius]
NGQSEESSRRENLPKRRFVRRGQPTSGELCEFRAVLSPKSSASSYRVRAVLSLEFLGKSWFALNQETATGERI